MKVSSEFDEGCLTKYKYNIKCFSFCVHIFHVHVGHASIYIIFHMRGFNLFIAIEA